MEFVEVVFRDVEDYLSRFQRAAIRTHKLLTHLSGADFRGFKFPEVLAPHWKNLMVNLVEDLSDRQDQMLIFFWDEFPLMLYDISQRTGPTEAMELLDSLRSLRHMHPHSLRMVFTGSIGLHNVIADLKRAGYANEPTNDMAKVLLPPLSPDDARELARRLIEGEGIRTRDPGGLARSIADSTDCVPYFIHHVVNRIVQEPGEPDAAMVDGMVLKGLTDPDDAWDMRYYRARIDRYYASSERPLALAILDVLAESENPLPFPGIFNGIKARLAIEDEELARNVVDRQLSDHYLAQESNGAYRFQFPLIRRWWMLHRGPAS